MKLRARLLNLTDEVERRQIGRHLLRLNIDIIAGDQGIEASAHDLSTTGLRIETDGELAVGDELLVELPDKQSVEARVVWKDERTYGCKFLTPIPNGVIGAAVLQAQFDVPSANRLFRVEEVELGYGIDVDFLAQWYADFEQRRASSGEQLIGFRKHEGRIIALISRLN